MGLEILRNDFEQIAPLVRCDAIDVETCGATPGATGWILALRIPDRGGEATYDENRIYAACDEACAESVIKTYGGHDGETWDCCFVGDFLSVMLTNGGMVRDLQTPEHLVPVVCERVPNDALADIRSRTQYLGTVPGLSVLTKQPGTKTAAANRSRIVDFQQAKARRIPR